MRVLILEDDPWMADLLKQIVQSLRSDAQIDCQSLVADAIDAWQREPAQLVITDWNLPDGPGTQLLERIRQDDTQVPLVMVTARADRNSVLGVLRLGISAFISKPFQVPKILASLEPLLNQGEAQAQPVAAMGDFLQHLATMDGEQLDLPLLRPLNANARQLRQLGKHWQNEPAVHARLIAAAHSSIYNPSGLACTSLGEALQRLGPATALSLLQGLALRPLATLSDESLQRLAEEHFLHALRLRQRVTELAALCRIDPSPLQSAALLLHMGELSVLQQTQEWFNRHKPLDDSTVREALQRYSSQFASRLKAHWRLPGPLRDLIGAAMPFRLATPGASRSSCAWPAPNCSTPMLRNFSACAGW